MMLKKIIHLEEGNDVSSRDMTSKDNRYIGVQINCVNIGIMRIIEC